MTEVSGELFSVLPEGLPRLLATPPVTEKKLLELNVTWTGLPPEQARIAEQLRLFVITWDPLERLAVRPDGVATVNADLSGFELVVYAPVWSVVESAAEQGITVAAVLAAMASSAVVAATAHEQSVTSGRGADTQRAGLDLLSYRAAGSALGTPVIGLVSPGWEDIGLGAITDIVQHAFGPVDLDRSMVELAAVAGPCPGCAACGGRRLACGAKIGDLGEEHGHRVLRARGKGGKVVLIPLPPAVARALDRAVDGRDGGPILRNTLGARMDRHAATRRLKHLAAAAGIRMPRMHPRMLRHTFVTTMLDAGVSLRDVQIAARHAIPVRPSAMTVPARTLTGTPTTSSPRTWPRERSGGGKRLCRVRDV